MLDLYTASKLGPMKQKAFTAVAARVRLTAPKAGEQALYMLYADENVYVLQGISTVTATSTTATLVTAGTYMPLVVESELDAFISIIRESADGTLNITLVSDTADWTLTDA